MAVRIASHLLVGMLMDLVQTAHPDPAVGGPLAGVVLHSARGELGEAPGQVDLLAGASMNRAAAGHCYDRAEGVLDPMLWPLADTRAVIAVLKPKAKAAKDEDEHHAVVIHRTGAMVELVEDPGQKPLFDDGQLWRMSFALGKLDDFSRGLWDLLRATAVDQVVIDHDHGGRVRPRPRTDYNAAALAPFVAVAKRRKAGIEEYRYHQRRPVLVQIGSQYRGAILPERYPDSAKAGTAPDRPDADVHAPVLPPRAEPVPAGAERVDLDHTDDPEGTGAR